MSPRRRRRCGGWPARPAWTMTWLMTCCAGGQPGWPPRARSSPRRSCRNSPATRPARPRPRPRRRRGKRRRRPARPPGGTGRPAPRRRRRPASPASTHGKPPPRHARADRKKRVLARGGNVVFVIKGNQPRPYQALNDIGWEQIPIAAATFEADRGRIETRTIQVAPAPEGLKYPDMKQAGLIERYTTFKDKKGKTVTRSETVL